VIAICHGWKVSVNMFIALDKSVWKRVEARGIAVYRLHGKVSILAPRRRDIACDALHGLTIIVIRLTCNENSYHTTYAKRRILEKKGGAHTVICNAKKVQTGESPAAVPTATHVRTECFGRI